MYQEETGIVLRGASRYATNPEFTTMSSAHLEVASLCQRHTDPFILKGSSSLNVRVRLCQKDSWKSVVILDTKIVVDFRYADEEVKCTVCDFSHQLRADLSTAGLILAGILRIQGIEEISVKSSFTMIFFTQRRPRISRRPR